MYDISSLQDSKENMKIEMGNSATNNIVLNHEFSEGLHMWHPNCCEAYVVPAGTGNNGTPTDFGSCYAVITNRKECWQGLEQDITNRVSTGSTYTVRACVGVSGTISGSTDVLATLKLEYQDSATRYHFIGRYSYLSHYVYLIVFFQRKSGIIMEVLCMQKTCYRRQLGNTGRHIFTVS